MPTYEYECPRCGWQFERFQRISDAPVRACPKCRGKVRRLIFGGSGLIFRGSGFYITDYARKKKSSEASGSDKSSTADTKSSDKPKPAETKAEK